MALHAAWMLLLIQCAPSTAGTVTAPLPSVGKRSPKPQELPSASVPATPPETTDSWYIPSDLQLDPAPANYALSLGVSPEPKGLLPPDEACKDYLRHRVTRSSEPCETLLDSFATEPSPVRRDERLAIALETCRSVDVHHSSTMIQVIRAEIAPSKCAETLALDLLNNPPSDLDPELRDVLHAQLLRGRLARVPKFHGPLFRGPWTAPELERWDRMILGKAYARHARLLETLSKTAEPLSGSGAAVAWAYLALAWLRLENETGTWTRQPFGPDFDDKRHGEFGRKVQALMRLPRTAKFEAEAKARAFSAQYVDGAEPGLLEMNEAITLRPSSPLRTMWTLLQLVGVDLGPAPPPLVLLAQLLAPRYVQLRAGEPSDETVEALLNVGPSGVHRARFTLVQTLRAARTRLNLAVRYGSQLQVDRAISLLAKLSPSDRTDEVRLLLALAVALRGAWLTMRDPHALRSLDAIAEHGGPLSAHAALLAAHFRSAQADAVLSLAYFRGAVEFVQERGLLDKLENACNNATAAAAKLPPELALRIAPSVGDCESRFGQWKSEFQTFLHHPE